MDWGDVRPIDAVDQQIEAWRTPFEVDSDRLLYAPEFRRLARVTQVLSATSDYVLHDRLTHSLKVGQTAQRLASYLLAERARSSENTASEIAELRDKFLDPQVCYAAGLAHDLGHPPYGHIAEMELQRVLATGLDVLRLQGREVLADSFEGNAQTMRIVTLLSFRKPVIEAAVSDEELTGVPQEEGLNLTWRVLAAIAKYPWLRRDDLYNRGQSNKKWSFYNSERPYLDELRRRKLIDRYRAPQLRQSLEAQVMDWSDDIAYAVHDTEDFFRARRIPLDRLSLTAPSGERSDWAAFYEFAWSRVRNKVFDQITGKQVDVSAKLFKSVANQVRLTFPNVPFSGTRTAYAAVNATSSRLIELLQGGVGLRPTKSIVPAGADELYLAISIRARLTAEFLKALTHFYVIETPDVAAIQVGQREVAHLLFVRLHEMAGDLLLDAEAATSSRRRLPGRLVEYVDRVMAPDQFSEYRNDEARLARAVIDFMCTLTDEQARLLHQRVSGDLAGPTSSYWLDV